MSKKTRQSKTRHIQVAKRREKIIHQVLDGKLSGMQAAKRLNVNPKTIYRIRRKYEKGGFEALVSKKRPGMISNRRYSDEIRAQTKNFLMANRDFRPFAPKALAEKLYQDQNIKLSKETMRLWMIDWKIWKRTRNKSASKKNKD